MNVCFVDLETTGLSPEHNEAYEVALIDHEDNEYHWWLPIDLGKADAQALEVGKFYDRYPWTRDLITPLNYFAKEFSELTRGMYLAGAVVSFDEGFLRKILRDNGACPGWNHRLICVETMAAGVLKHLPNGLGVIAEELLIPIDPNERHTAMGDAKACRDIFNLIMEREANA